MPRGAPHAQALHARRQQAGRGAPRPALCLVGWLCGLRNDAWPDSHSAAPQVHATEAEDCDLSVTCGAAGWRRAAAAAGVALSLAVATAAPVLAATPPPAVEDETLLSDFDVRAVPGV